MYEDTELLVALWCEKKEKKREKGRIDVRIKRIYTQNNGKRVTLGGFGYFQVRARKSQRQGKLFQLQNASMASRHSFIY